MTKENRETLRKIRNVVANGHQDILDKLLDPNSNRPGRQSVPMHEEEAIISRRLNYVVSKGFAADGPTLQQLIGQIAADGRTNKHKLRIPSSSTVRVFRTER